MMGLTRAIGGANPDCIRPTPCLADRDGRLRPALAFGKPEQSCRDFNDLSAHAIAALTIVA